MDPRDASAFKKRRYDIFIFLILNNHVRNDLYLSESRSKVAHFLFAFALTMKNISLLLIKTTEALSYEAQEGWFK